jgi:hypothetical protein
MAVLIYEKWRDRPLSIKPVVVLFIICIFVSCFQAWVDEHRNSEQLKIEKSQISGDAGFWREQSYAKDESLRQRDAMLAQNFGVLSNTQNSLAALSNKLLDTTKPSPTVFDVHRWQFPASYTFPDIGKVKLWVIVVTTNKTIPGIKGTISCDAPVTFLTSHMLTHGNLLRVEIDRKGDRTAYAEFPFPPMSPQNPLLFAAYTKEDAANIENCTFNQN